MKLGNNGGAINGIEIFRRSIEVPINDCIWVSFGLGQVSVRLS